MQIFAFGIHENELVVLVQIDVNLVPAVISATDELVDWQSVEELVGNEDGELKEILHKISNYRAFRSLKIFAQ